MNENNGIAYRPMHMKTERLRISLILTITYAYALGYYLVALPVSFLRPLRTIVSFVIILYYLVKLSFRLSKIICAVAALILLHFALIFFYNGQISALNSYFMQLILVLSIEYYIHRGQIKSFFLNFMIAGYLLFILNLVIKIDVIGINGTEQGFYGKTEWFLGHRNGLILFFLMWILSAFMYSYLRYGKLKFFVWITFVLSVTMEIIVWSATSLLAFVLLAALLFVPILAKRLTITHFLIIAIGLNIFIVFLRMQDMFAFIIEDMLQRSLTFTGRTYIWDTYIHALSQSPIIGYNPTELLFVTHFNRPMLPHNMWLMLLYNAGVVGLIIYAIIIVLAVRELRKYHASREAQIISVITFVFLISQITESGFLYILPYTVIAYHIRKIINRSASL